MRACRVDEQAAQCAFCSSGIIMGTVAWIRRRIAAGNRAVPSEAEVKTFLAGKDFSPTGSIPPGSSA